MRIKNDGLRKGELPTIISDLNGNIIYVNSRAATSLYPIKVGDSVSKFVDLDYIRKISIFENKIDIVSPRNTKYEKLVIRTVGSGMTKTIELYFANSEKDGLDELEKEKRFFSTYGEIVSVEANESVELNNFITRVVDYMHSDLRFAYRKFNIVDTENKECLFANYAHLSVIAVGTIIALNEIEYRNPMELSIENINSEYSLNISVPTNTFVNAEGLSDLAELYPRIAMRLIYLTSLCEDNDIKYKFTVKPNRVTANYIITEHLNKTGKFGYATFGMDQLAFVSYIMDIFSPDDTNDTSKEEQE